MDILSPAAAVGLRELDMAAGTADFTVRVLSPRILGGWCCQVWAARAVEALSGSGITCQTGEMEYLSTSDCFCVVLTASWPVVRREEGWGQRQRQLLLGDAVQEGVESFRAVRSQGRRLFGGFNQPTPVGVTPGSGGWSLELVQRTEEEPEEPEEPFTLTLREGERVVRYTGCCWNETVWSYEQNGPRLTRRGFALEREVGLDE